MDEAINTDDLVSPDTESDLLSWTNSSPFASKETLGKFWRHFAFVLVPPPFGLLVFLATLPATLQGLPAHPTVLIMAVLLLALMILQGTLLYFAGSNDTILTLDIVGGYALFIVVGVFAAFGPIRRVTHLRRSPDRGTPPGQARTPPDTPGLRGYCDDVW